MDAKELKPCPFCGSEKVKHFAYTHPEPDHIYQCNDCASIGGGGKKEAEAREKWNRRADAQEAADAKRYRFIRSMKNMPDEEKDRLAEIMAEACPHSADPTDANFDKAIDAAIAGEKKE